MPALRALGARLRRSRDLAAGDWEMALNRFIAGLLVLLFNLYGLGGDIGATSYPRAGALAYLGLGLLLLGYCIAAPKAIRVRRVLAMLLDFGAVSYELHIGGWWTAWLYPAYLWVIFGNGFRFGSGFLLLAMGVSTAMFGLMLWTTPFWRMQQPLAIGMLVGMIIVPIYALVLIRRLSQARRQAEEASQAKSLFLASVSHELRTPLNAIVGTGALLEDRATDAEQREMSRTILTAANTLLSLIDGILNLSRIEAGKMPEISADFDLADLLGQLRRMTAGQARAKGLFLNIHVAARTPVRLVGDNGRLRDILLNLVSNAIKFTNQGGVAVAVDMVERTETTARLRFEVTDTGIGIEPEARHRIFEIFEQANPTILDRFGGTGLGLAITRKSVQLLRGEIGVDSTMDVGSTFWVEIDFTCRGGAAVAEAGHLHGLQAALMARAPAMAAPLVARLSDLGIAVHPASPAEAALMEVFGAPGDETGILLFQPRDEDATKAPSGVLAAVATAPLAGPALTEARRRLISVLTPQCTDDELMTVLSLVRANIAAPPRPAVPGRPRPLWSLRILVADDNRANQLVLSRILERAGHSVRVVSDGEEALDLLAEADFDLAIMDVNMPVMGGIEAVKLYRFGAIGDPHLPILALTADATPETRQRCLDAGMDACVTKPVEPDTLLAAIDGLMAPGRPEAAPKSGIVARIDTHPKFREAGAPAVNAQVIARLLDLAGPAFLQEVTDEYLTDAKAILARLQDATARSDVATFRAQAHAMCSGAANLGATMLYELCTEWQTISAEEMAAKGESHVRRLAAELARVESALRNWDAKGVAKR
ncbi:response regulator [Gluconacetobacter sacchari]|uniref:response regulator n=1 Tax=Gluconacetobacter sacchari TaxID=92759 RepID=UPI0039B4A491